MGKFLWELRAKFISSPIYMKAPSPYRGEELNGVLIRVLCIFAQKYTLRGVQNCLIPESNFDLECILHKESRFPTQ